MTELDILREAVTYAAKHSHDPRTQVGAVLKAGKRLVYGANIVPPGVIRDGDKYAITEHAERAAIYKAAATGVPTAGATLYAPWFACPDCARAIILAGVVEVVGLTYLDYKTPLRWREQVDLAVRMLRQAGVATRWVGNAVGATLLFDGEKISC